MQNDLLFLSTKPYISVHMLWNGRLLRLTFLLSTNLIFNFYYKSRCSKNKSTNFWNMKFIDRLIVENLNSFPVLGKYSIYCALLINKQSSISYILKNVQIYNETRSLSTEDMRSGPSLIFSIIAKLIYFLDTLA